MKRMVLRVAFALASAAVSVGEAAAESDPRLPEGGLFCERPTFDFGKLENVETVRHTFVLENRGDRPVKILKVVTGCGCTTGRAGSDSLDPGKTLGLDVTFRLIGRRGPQRKSIYMHTDGPGGLRQLVLLGEAVQASSDGAGPPSPVPVALAAAETPGRLRVRPERLDLGAIRRDVPTSSWIELGIPGATEIRVGEVRSLSPFLAIWLDKGTNGSASRISVRTVPPLDPGLLTGEILVVADVGGRRETKVPVIGRVMNDIDVVPGEIVVGAWGSVSNAVTRYLRVRSRGRRPFRLLRAQASAPSAMCDVSASGPDGAWLVVIRNMIPAEFEPAGSVTLRTDRDEEQRVVVPVRVPCPASEE